MKKLRKCYVGVFLTLFLMLGSCAEAAGYQLNISLGKEGSGVTLAAYRIADATEQGYEWRKEYEGIGIELSQLKKAKEMQEAAKKLQSWIEEKKLSATHGVTTDQSGKTVILAESGAYLIVKESTEGEMSPVLVMIPKDYDGESLEISPKYSSVKTDDANQNAASDTGNQTDQNGTNQNGKGAGTGDAVQWLCWGLAMLAAVAAVILIKKKS